MEIPSEILPLFLAGGWHADRRVPLPEGLCRMATDTHPAIEILRSLSGLRVGTTGAGLECATSDIDFMWLADDFVDSIEPWEQLLDTQLIGVAELSGAHGALYVATDGRCFGLSLIHDAFFFLGESFGIALERLLRGRRARPMLLPDQERVSLYGIELTHASPDLYRYESKAKP